MQRRYRLGLAVICGVALIAGSAFAQDTITAKGPDAARIKKGFAVAPVKLKLKGLNPDLVGLGSYIVNGSGDCAGCHSNPTFAPGGDPHLGQPEKLNIKGYLAGGQSFGPVTSANLTPDPKGRPGGMSYKQFYNAIRYGKDPENPKRILQVMPWPAYRHMLDSEIRAVYEYLRAIPSIKTTASTTAASTATITEPDTSATGDGTTGDAIATETSSGQ